MTELLENLNQLTNIYDHSMNSWILMGGYVIVGLLAIRFSWQSKGVKYGHERVYWILFSLFLFFLAYNRFSGILLEFTSLFRVLAESQYLYKYRRPIQLLVIVEFLLLTVMVIRNLYQTRRLHKRTIITMVGILLLLSELLIETLSYHYLDTIFNRTIALWSLNGVLETMGLGLVGFAVLWGTLRDSKFLKRSSDPSLYASH